MHRRWPGVLYLALALVLLAAAPAGAVQPRKNAAKGKAHASEPGKPPFDVRNRGRRPAPGPDDARTAAQRERLSDQLGRQGVLDFDGRTNTARFVGRLDGFLTGASGDDPVRIALGYVRSHEAVFGLSAADVAALELVRRYTDGGGTTHLVWAQVHDGITAFDNDLHANVAADGRLINVSGSPLAEVATRTTDPALSASDAVATALVDAGRPGGRLSARERGTPDRLTTFAGGHDARLVLFNERPGDTHLAWKVTARKDGDEVYDYVIDARSGDLLYRQNTVDFASATLNVWEYAPNIDDAPGFGLAPDRSGDQQAHNTLFGGDPIQVNSGAALDGPYAHVYPDVNDDNQPDQEIPANAGTSWTNTFLERCGIALFPWCSWNGTAGDATVNLRQNAAQVYYFVNNFHDWLQKEPNVGFNAASGNFEAAGGDAVQAQVLDGAAILDGDHTDNANMTTLSDGTPPLMQMYLFTGAGTAPFGNGGDDATIIYHEYAHGLTNRLVTGGTGASTLNSFHANSMGEGWSDFYAMDYLFDQGLDTGDTGTDGEVVLGFYITGGQVSSDLRSEPLDCAVNSASGACPGGNTGRNGGYHLGDMGSVINGPEVHADGEIWAQTLWQLRQTIGEDPARRVITDGLRLSPPDPSFLDMRNAILQADQVAFGGSHLTQIWQVFANRGMGAAAAVDDGSDTTPVASFSPPADNGTTVTGRVTDAGTGAGIGGAYVHFDASAAPGDYATMTDANGNYTLSAVQPATFGRVLVSAPGFGHLERANVQAGSGAIDFGLERNFAATASGGSIAAFNGVDFSADGCGPGSMLDSALTTGWASTSPNNAQDPGAKAIVVRLPQAVDVTSIGVDPTAVCGDGDSASTGQFRIDVSSDGANFTQVGGGVFNGGNLRRVNTVAGAASNVRFVRYTMLTPLRQSTTGGDGEGGVDSGVLFMDASEIEVFGRPAAAVPPPPGGLTGLGDVTAPIGRLSLASRQRLLTVLRRGLKLRARCNERCAWTATATIDARTAKRVKLLSRRSRARTFKVASGRLRQGSGTRTLTLRFTARARKRLRRLRSVRLTVAGRVVDPAGNAARRSSRFTVRR